MCEAADDPSPARKQICPSTSVPPEAKFPARTGVGDIQVDDKQNCRIFACFQRLITISSLNVGTAVYLHICIFVRRDHNFPELISARVAVIVALQLFLTWPPRLRRNHISITSRGRARCVGPPLAARVPCRRWGL